MDYEKKYKEALAWIRSLHPTMKGAFREDAEHYFPELKESEDERIRKMIIYQMERWHEAALENNAVQDIKDSADAITWLEKQGEQKQWVHVDPISEEDKLQMMFDGQKPADKDEPKYVPKFHEGDWVIGRITKNEPRQIAEVTEEGYKTTYGGWIGSSFEKDLRLWTIQDAKDGDVLAYKDEISLYKHDIKNCTKQETTFGGFVYYCCYDGKRFIMDSLYSLTEQDKMDIHPATKEQRDALERAIINAGYRWDKEKLKLEKI